jgi:hypothetical protein
MDDGAFTITQVLDASHSLAIANSPGLARLAKGARVVVDVSK